MEPHLLARCLGSSQDFHKALASHGPHIHIVCCREVPVKGSRIELSQAIDLVDIRVQTVGHRNVNQPVVAAQGHSWLGTFLGQWKEA